MKENHIIKKKEVESENARTKYARVCMRERDTEIVKERESEREKVCK